MADDTQRAKDPREGRDGNGGRAGRRTVTDMASWVLVAAMVVVAGGAAGYIYMQHRTTPTAAHTQGHVKAHSAHKGAQAPKADSNKKSGAKETAAQKGSSYYPPLGTPARPVTGNVIEGFGWQYQKNIGLYRDVPGWALKASTGTAVRAVVGGRVVANWVDPTEGREVVVDSSNGDSVIYGDLATPGPAVGEVVRSGQVFAKVGTPGKLSGVAEPHLFLEVTVAGQPVSPATLLGQVPGADATTSAATTGVKG